MKTIRLAEDEAVALKEATRILADGGLVCAPCQGSYRIVASLKDEDAVTRLMQSKRRVSRSPSLVFLHSAEVLHDLTDEVDPVAEQLAAKQWPGSLTILFTPSDELPRKVRKQVARANGKIGVRVPSDPFMRALCESVGEPLLISSANREKKAGSESAAQVRKNFMGRIDLFVDAGDLSPGPSSTVVDIVDGTIQITRPGALSEDDLLAG